MMIANRKWLAALAVAGLAGCDMDGSIGANVTGDDGVASKSLPETWSSADSPTKFSADLEFQLDKLPKAGEATKIPWAGNYWPVYQDVINYRWDGASSDSPAKKYEKAFGLTGVEDAVSEYHGIDNNKDRKACTKDTDCDKKIGEACAKRTGETEGRCIPTWWGICHAWAPASILEPEPVNPVTINGVTFKVNDIKALVSLVYDQVQDKFVSLRCNLDNEANEIEFDANGRPTNRSCRDSNAGSFHLLITNYLGIKKQAFVYDRTWDDEVWNQPLRGFKVSQMKEVTAAEANRIIGMAPVGGTTERRDGSVARDAWVHLGGFAVKPGDNVKVSMTGTEDADLYVRFGAQPTDRSYNCRPYKENSNEDCELTAPQGASQVFVSVNGYAETSDYRISITVGGGLPTTYSFNTAAAKLYHVKAEAYYITESNASTDGNLSSTISRYTKTDRFEYILETDASGKVNGGEWAGASRTSHPDFAWLPIRSTVTTVAGGKISFDRVKEILGKSVSTVTPPPPGGVNVKESFTVIANQRKEYGPYTIASGSKIVVDMTGDGDADLVIRKKISTGRRIVCRAEGETSTESCSAAGPGEFYVTVSGYAQSSNVEVNIRSTTGL
ncbi:MAG: pre-peptidase C-terminal domain-containing protein [Deltaproteobacteria bacterium]|nr:pre-peptidase C-terminal domain-containing protein [Deltaproteobacteria bacterium]